MEKPIFILGSHKSGTSLLRALLDGAEELFVIPMEAHFFQYGGFWVDYALRRALPRQYTFDELVENFVRHIERTNRKEWERSSTSDSILTGLWDVPAFADYFHSTARAYYQKADFRGMFDCYVEAVHVSLFGVPPSSQRFVEKSVENAEFATLLKRLYPQARFVHLIRNPYATLVAIRRHSARKRYPFLARILSALRSSYYYLYQNPLVLEDYRVVRYEDLVTQPREVMQSLAEFLEIGFGPGLLEPTVMGKPWGGNSTSGRQFDGVSRSPLSHWQSEIHPLEADLISQLFGHVLRDHSYDPYVPSGSVYLPMPREGVRTFLVNRWLWLQARHSQPLSM